MFDEAAPELPGAAPRLERPGPPPLAGSQQPLLAPLQLSPAALVHPWPGQLALDADEFGPVGVATLVEPVGVDQPGRVVLRVSADVLEEGFFQGHGLASSEPGRPRYRLPKSKSTTQQPSACGPPERQCSSISAWAQPTSSSASARTGRSSKARPS